MSISEVQAAREAIDRGDVDQALHHINNLQLDGRYAADVQDLQRRLWQLDNTARQRNLSLQFYAIASAVLGYGLLTFESPAAWSPLVWGLAAFLAIPVMVGVFAGSSVIEDLKAKRFWRGFGITSITMAVYTLVGMAIARSKMESADKSMDVAVFFVVMLVHGVVAGTVAGFMGAMTKAKAKTI